MPTLTPIDPARITETGTGLARPECVVCLSDGSVLTSHMGAGLMHISPGGKQRSMGSTGEVNGKHWIPNGFALLENGSALIANMGEDGGVWQLDSQGRLGEYLRQVDGVQLPATNFVLADALGRIWISITTRQWPISKAFNPTVADGFIVLVDQLGARIVADGLSFTNEMRLDASGNYLYVAETFAQRISRFRVLPDGGLGQRELFSQLGSGCFPDGIHFDAEGHLWVASIISNRVLRVAPDGSMQVMLDDSDPELLDRVEGLLASRQLTREDVQQPPRGRLKNISSITFGGPDLRTCYLGSLGGSSLITFRSPVAGLAPAHWNYRL